MIRIIQIIVAQGEDNPRIMKELLGISILNACKEVYQELKQQP